MRLLNQLNYSKPEPFRDSALFVIICEGEVREIDYFEYFDRLSRKIKVHAFSPKHGSAPNHVLETAQFYLSKYQDDTDDEIFDFEKDQFWLVMDTDHHVDLIHEVIRECEENGIMKYAISNPCFEVWLRFHFHENKLPTDLNKCSQYKEALSKVDNNGGFDSLRHPTLINTAIQNAEKNLEMDGYLPLTGSTTLFNLGNEIYSKVKNKLRKYDP